MKLLTILPRNFHPGLDQFTEYISYKDLLKSNNFSQMLTNPYNFTGMQAILKEFEDSFYSLNSFTTVVLLTLYVPVFLVGLIGNILVLLTVLTDRNIRRAKNVYLFNLAVSDLGITLLCIPITVGTIVYRLWFYGIFLCKFTAFLQGVVVASSIFTLTAMSIDRYVSIQHPVTADWVTSPNQALVITILIWTVSSLFMGPLLYIRHVDTLEMPLLNPLRFCIEGWPRDEDRRSYGVFLLLFVYIIPGCTLTVCYAHVCQTLCKNEMLQDESDVSSNGRLARKQAAKILLILVLVFMVFWLPYNMFSLFIDLSSKNAPTSYLPFTLWLGHAHSAANPIIYWIWNRRFRDRVRYTMKFIRRPQRFVNTPTPEFI